METIKKSGLFKIIHKKIETNGCYIADIIVDGTCIPGKTFFPQDWPRKKVISKIYEAYENFTQSGAIAKNELGGKYIIRGITQEGIEIEMFITKDGQMTTAYPIVTSGI
jgi:hypothetical protein